jgi:hypothetical protein
MPAGEEVKSTALRRLRASFETRLSALLSDDEDGCAASRKIVILRRARSTRLEGRMTSIQ